MWNVQDRCCAREQCGVPCAFGGRYMARTVWTTVGCCSLSCRPDRVAACLLYRAQDPCFSPPSLREWDPGLVLCQWGFCLDGSGVSRGGRGAARVPGWPARLLLPEMKKDPRAMRMVIAARPRWGVFAHFS